MIKKFASLPSVIKGKWALATPKTKKGIITGAVSVALLSTCIGGCAMNQAKNNDSTAPATTTEAQTETQDDSYGVISGSDVKDDEDSINFISDNLNISGLTIVSTQDSQSIADEIVPPTGDFDLDSDEYTIDPTTETEVEVDGDYYIAPDGTVWLTEQDYLDYINSQNTTEENPTVVEQEDDGFYHAPDGSVWATEQDYLDYINGQNTGGNEENPSQDTPVENPTENNDGSYRAPDGSYWSSEQDYLDYINEIGRAHV